MPFKDQLWCELGHLPSSQLRTSAMRNSADVPGSFVESLSAWLDTASLFGDRTHEPEWEEVCSLANVCEVLVSLIHGPGNSDTQRPKASSVERMSKGQLAFLSLIRELGVDVRLVAFMRDVPLVAPRIEGQLFKQLEKSLRGAFGSPSRPPDSRQASTAVWRASSKSP